MLDRDDVVPVPKEKTQKLMVYQITSTYIININHHLCV